MTKRKGQFDGTVQFVSTLPLQECVSRLENLQNDDLQIQFFRDSHDAIAFEANLLERGIIRAEAKGMLRRWEGTLTRVDYDVNIREGILRWLLIISSLFFVMTIGFPMIFMFGAATHMLLWLGISAIFIIAFLGMLVLALRFAPIDDTPQNLMHLIIDSLEA